MKGYSTSLARLASIYGKHYSPLSVDPSVDLLIHLALAYKALERLREDGAVLEYQNRPLVTPSLERAYHDTLWVRRNLPKNWEILDVEEITLFGRFVGDVKSKVSDPTT